MKLTYTTKSGNITVELEDNSQKGLWEKLGDFQEIFEETTCGKCGSENVRFVTREVDGNKFFELKCMERNCRARLSFGSHKKGDTLFPKRKDGAGAYLPDSGWVKYNKDEKKEE